MVAPAAPHGWARAVQEGLARLPVDLLWTMNADDAIRQVTNRPVHAALVDDALPVGGGLDLLRRFRRLGWQSPCVLVSEAVDPHLLKAALDVSAFSVLAADAGSGVFADMIVRIGRQCYQMDWVIQN